MCDHLYESTSRYDAARKLLTFLLVCPVCEIEEIVQAIEYAPNPIGDRLSPIGKRARALAR